MTVCKFFQQGYCRYGQNCRFEHIYGSKYSYHAQPPQPKSVGFAAPQAPQGVSDEQLVKQVQSDVQAALRGGQWILSCYSPIKEKAIFPGIPDLSPEEARLFIYEAKANNTLDQAVEYMNKMFQESRHKYEKLLQPDHNIIKVLKALYNGEQPASPFSNTNTVNDTASSIFRSAVQNSSQFSQNTAQSVFSQGQSSIFGSSAPDPAKELFSKATGSVFNTNTSSSPFGQSNTASSPFGQTNTASSFFSQANTASSPFGQTNASSSPFGQTNTVSSPFAQNNTAPSPFGQNTAQSIFASAVQTNASNPNPNTAASIFATGNQNVAGNSPFGSLPNSEKQPSMFAKDQQEDLGIYSRVDEVDEEDLEAFKASSFKLGFVPEIPPPLSLCSVQIKSGF